MSLYRVKQPGDVLALSEPLDGLPEGPWVLLALLGDIALLSRLGENEDGDLCTTCRVEAVGLADLSLFRSTGLELGLLA